MSERGTHRRSWLRGYEERVRFFLGLLVFVLAAANTANFLLLRSAWISLRDAVEEAVDVRGATATRSVRAAVEAVGAGGASGEAGSSGPSSRALARLAETSGCLHVSLLTHEGLVLSASDDSGAGSRDQDVPSGLTLRPPAPGSLSFSPSVRIVDRGGLMIRFEAIRGGMPGEGLLVKTVHDTDDLAQMSQSYRWLVWTQTIAILVVLIAAFAFGRWIARPYRAIVKEAGAAALVGEESDPEDLVAAIRRVTVRLREQDEERLALAREAGAGGAAARRFVESVARRMTSGLVLVDGAGALLAANPAAVRILGWAVPLPTSAPLEEWTGRGTPLSRLVSEALAGEGPRGREEIEHLAAGPEGAPGRRLLLGVAISPVAGPGETEVGSGRGADGVICLIADLTEVRELEDKVRRREQLAALGTVSAGIAHEVRNALGVILGHARLAEKEAPASGAAHARAIAEEVRAVSRTVEEFLRFARPSRLTLIPLDLRQVLDAVIEDAAASGLLERMEVRVEGEPGQVRGDEQALRQAFGNLVRNAAQSCDRPVRLSIRAEREAAHATIVLEDDGDGIVPENMDRIFLPFFTTRGRGTGLGLALAQKAIVDHEGSIEVSSTGRGGASFKVRLPLA